MSPSGAEFIRKVKSEITEVDPSEVNGLLDNGVALVDVRETEEFASGHLPGARHVPRGYLESRIEGAVPDRVPAGRSSTARRETARPWPPAPSRRSSATRTWRRCSAGSRCGRTAATRSRCPGR